jgi:hypothetical protein
VPEFPSFALVESMESWHLFAVAGWEERVEITLPVQRDTPSQGIRASVQPVMTTSQSRRMQKARSPRWGAAARHPGKAVPCHEGREFLHWSSAENVTRLRRGHKIYKNVWAFEYWRYIRLKKGTTSPKSQCGRCI